MLNLKFWIMKPRVWRLSAGKNSQTYRRNGDVFSTILISRYFKQSAVRECMAKNGIALKGIRQKVSIMVVDVRNCTYKRP